MLKTIPLKDPAKKSNPKGIIAKPIMINQPKIQTNAKNLFLVLTYKNSNLWKRKQSIKEIKLLLLLIKQEMKISL